MIPKVRQDQGQSPPARSIASLDLSQLVPLLRPQLADLLIIVASDHVASADVHELRLDELAFFGRIVTTRVEITTTWGIQRRGDVALENDATLLGLRVRDR